MPLPCNAVPLYGGGICFSGLRHEVAYVAVERGTMTQPDALPSVPYQDMQQK